MNNIHALYMIIDNDYSMNYTFIIHHEWIFIPLEYSMNNQKTCIIHYSMYIQKFIEYTLNVHWIFEYTLIIVPETFQFWKLNIQWLFIRLFIDYSSKMNIHPFGIFNEYSKKHVLYIIHWLLV